ncbi:hypothetical protein Bbelb_013460 [Branchiostoma belcheri]|nr:hypothetical protein Bbelb_013460 [Branchiostoma belcheri]
MSNSVAAASVWLIVMVLSACLFTSILSSPPHVFRLSDLPSSPMRSITDVRLSTEELTRAGEPYLVVPWMTDGRGRHLSPPGSSCENDGPAKLLFPTPTSPPFTPRPFPATLRTFSLDFVSTPGTSHA